MLPIGRGWRLLIVILLGFGFVGWVFYFAGTTFAAQFEALRAVVEAQVKRLYRLGAERRPGHRPDAGHASASSCWARSAG